LGRLGVAKLPLNLAQSLNALREASASVSEPASIRLAGDQALVERARELFSQGGTVPSSYVGSLGGPAGAALAPGEVLVVLTTPEGEAEAVAALGAPAPKGSVILAVDGGPGTKNRASRLAGGVIRLSFSDSDAGWDRLFSLCAEAAGDNGVALGRRYPVVRRAAAHRLIARTSAQNVFISAVFFVPGSDMPAMTANQVRMVLKIAALYGESIDRERAVELVGLVALGFGFRGLSRLLVRSVPGLAMVMRMLIAYSATTAVGLGAVAYFEKGAPASTSKVIALAGSLRH
jgi:uncharacterized protein (DUF697 family)